MSLKQWIANGALLALIVAGLAPLAIGNSVQVANNSQSITVVITDAYYTAVGEDGIEDDVVIHFSIDMYREGGRGHFNLYFQLTLPSGRMVEYGYLINTAYTSLEGIMIFHNDATESGMYNIRIIVQLFSGGAASGDADHDFDPPGETSGGDPHGDLRLL